MMIDRSGVGYGKDKGAHSRLATMSGGEAGKQSEKDILGNRLWVIDSASGEVTHNGWSEATVHGFE